MGGASCWTRGGAQPAGRPPHTAPRAGHCGQRPGWAPAVVAKLLRFPRRAAIGDPGWLTDAVPRQNLGVDNRTAV